MLKSLSDINGSEVYIHAGHPTGVLRELTNALARTQHRPTVLELQAIYRDVKRTAEILKRELATKSLFDTRPFGDLVLAAIIVVLSENGKFVVTITAARSARPAITWNSNSAAVSGMAT